MTDNEATLLKMRDAAAAAGHIFPEYAACEGALESAWFTSKEFTVGLNVFGQKAPAKLAPNQHTFVMNTNEVINGQDQMVSATWVKFNDLSECFAARMALLRRLPIYADALRATSGRDFVMHVSARWQIISPAVMLDPTQMAALPSFKIHPVITVENVNYQFMGSRWSTDPHRGPSVLQIYSAHKAIFQLAVAAA